MNEENVGMEGEELKKWMKENSLLVSFIGPGLLVQRDPVKKELDRKWPEAMRGKERE